MTATSSYSPTGDAYVDGVLSGVKWGVNALTFSFPTQASHYGSSYASGEQNNNFEAFTAVQQAAVRAALQNFSAVANLTFTEVTETASQHGELRYAESDAVGTAWAYYPSTSAAGGDAWFNNSKNYYDSPAKGNYAYFTVLHETGHAMGLKHSQDARGAFAAIPADRDSIEYTVMSYHSYVGSPLSGYTISSSSYPQTLMMYDIAALQTLYGANYGTNGGDTVYKWNPATGEMSLNGVGQGAPVGNRIFMTIWDGGGNDTYDFSAYSGNLTVNLAPGEWSITATTQLAGLGSGHYAAGNIANALLHKGNAASLIEAAIGGSGSDTLIGNQADNRLTGNGGNDLLDGGLGSDTAVFSGLSGNYAWSQNGDGSWTVIDNRSGQPDGTDTLRNIEFLQFADVRLALDGETPPTEPTPTEPTPVNTAPVITSAAQSVVLTEWADGSNAEATNALHSAAGSLSFTDADASDSHTASFAARGAGYLGSFALNAAEIDGSHQVGWSFSVADGAIDFLAAGQTLTQLYDVVISDGRGGSVSQTVTVSIVGADDPVIAVTPVDPVAVDDSYAIGKNGKLAVTAGKGLLANDVDGSGNAASVVLVGKTSHGTLKLNADGSFNYAPAKNYTGSDSFTYKVNDGSSVSNVATVTIGIATPGKGNGSPSEDIDQIGAPLYGYEWHLPADFDLGSILHGSGFIA